MLPEKLSDATFAMVAADLNPPGPARPDLLFGPPVFPD
jgi:hypothetical protein